MPKYKADHETTKVRKREKIHDLGVPFGAFVILRVFGLESLTLPQTQLHCLGERRDVSPPVCFKPAD